MNAIAQLFEKSAEIAPNTGANKWLYLAQLQEREEALQSFTKGIELLQAELESRKVRVALYLIINAQTYSSSNLMRYYLQSQGLGQDEESTAILNQLCSAYCSIAELYLTDLCYEENAENHCQDALTDAQKYDENRSPEVSSTPRTSALEWAFYADRLLWLR